MRYPYSEWGKLGVSLKSCSGLHLLGSGFQGEASVVVSEDLAAGTQLRGTCSQGGQVGWNQ